MTIYTKIASHASDIKKMHMRDMFNENPNRFNDFHVEMNDFLLDYSKNNITQHTMSLLQELATESNLKQAITDMFTGKKINTTENRAVLHTALRNMSDEPVYVDDENVMIKIKSVLKQMIAFSNQVRGGNHKGATGKSITDIVNIGIGGSDLGPKMAVEALDYYKTPHLNFHFISNVDATDSANVLKKCNPETTLFIVASKTFTTQETMMNATTCKNWLTEKLGENATRNHFVALSTNTKAVSDFGIDKDNMFAFWDFVGGRYSMWGAIGLSIMLAIGKDNFLDMLQGAYEMDTHFKTAPFEKNMPVIMGLIGVWHTTYLGTKSHAVLPYDQYLDKFPLYLQQLDMESNGKSVKKNGRAVDYQTGPIVFGSAGTNGQHSFYQLLHQGMQAIPADFVMPMISLNETGNHHDVLLSNFIAQTEALMRGKTAAELKTEGVPDSLIPFKTFEGNRATNSLLFTKLTPRNFGSLVALYEHKVFVQGVIWNVNSFDQFGVELGKKLATNVLGELNGNNQPISHDSSTNALIKKVRKAREKYRG